MVTPQRSHSYLGRDRAGTQTSFILAHDASSRLFHREEKQQKSTLCVRNPHIGLVSGTPWIKQKPGRWKSPAGRVARAWDGPGDASSEPLWPQPRGAATQAPLRPPGRAGHLHRGCGSWDPEQPGYDQATRLARPALPRSRSRGPGQQSRGPDPSQQAPAGWQVLEGAACRHSAPFQGDNACRSSTARRGAASTTYPP